MHAVDIKAIIHTVPTVHGPHGHTNPTHSTKTTANSTPFGPTQEASREVFSSINFASGPLQ